MSLEYKSVITGLWYTLEESESRSAMLSNSRIYKWYYIRGFIRRKGEKG